VYSKLLQEALSHAVTYLDGLEERRVGPDVTVEELSAGFDRQLPHNGEDPLDVLSRLVEGVDPGLMGTAGPRFFGFVIGGSYPVAVAADWLAAAWDQNSGLYAAAPATSVVEDVAGRWLVDLFGLPESSSFGFVTGGQMANYTGLAAARNHVLTAVGWNVEERGLQGAPTVRVVAGDERHATIDRSLRFLGLGSETMHLVDADDQGRIKIDSLRAALEGTEGPTIVCAQAGNVNTGAFDPIAGICDLAHEVGAWVHVDGAFGLWAAASPRFSSLVEGVGRADSWATDAHKWLNVPYDSGIAFCAHPATHQAAMGVHASYLVHTEGRERDEMDWNPEFSRRARGLAVYATLRFLGRSGVAALVERCCDHARRFAEILAAEPGIEVLNDVVLNQVLVRFLADDGRHDARTSAVIKGVQEDGTCWLGGSAWKGMGVMRISVSNWSTTSDDVEQSAEAVLRIARST
jgi:glutamate/tyrosine decarboxylase-like PLP-dependent enzyme